MNSIKHEVAYCRLSCLVAILDYLHAAVLRCFVLEFLACIAVDITDDESLVLTKALA